MNRRPLLIVILAILQFFSPLIYILTASFTYEIPISATAREIFTLNTGMRNIELFFLPPILGALIYLMRKTGYYFVILSSIYLIIRGILAFIDSNETDPVLPIILTNALSLFVVAYFSKRRIRDLHLNPRLRWWETSPRYIVNLKASLTRIGANPTKAHLQNIAVGGAGVESPESGFLTEEMIYVEFQHEGTEYRLSGRVVWERPLGTNQFLGIQWSEENSNVERSKMRRLMRDLRVKKYPTTRGTTSRWYDLKSWFSG